MVEHYVNKWTVLRIELSPVSYRRTWDQLGFAKRALRQGQHSHLLQDQHRTISGSEAGGSSRVRQ